ncbi:SH3 domain-containing protein [Brenneria tiliae]|uniref:SH3 domain-containing protein n=1 Tax=Brenneria tiliae TaxID=2914984 RepID=A0ABT0MXA1_9GAMM|nr:SH3 domain-containing protein [Brenneria tiliae]MCL2894476.1 SH3 domain-containing protein [Brenneria tiliae]MCL2897370.1 SH3 domain-containing protein [Brenneria tiliae]MCL2901687.1 SH3 domain-containing protein [Brenneria tiliae]
MNMRIVLVLLSAFGLASCKAPPPPALTDDTIVTNEVNGVTLVHRHAIVPPQEFQPINQEYRALYAASVMSRPDFSGKVVRHLENNHTYNVLGQVENAWLAIAEQGQEELIGYVPPRAAVKSELYEETLKKDRLRKPRRQAQKPTCVSVDGSGKACRNTNSGTWIID